MVDYNNNYLQLEYLDITHGVKTIKTVYSHEFRDIPNYYLFTSRFDALRYYIEEYDDSSLYYLNGTEITPIENIVIDLGVMYDFKIHKGTLKKEKLDVDNIFLSKDDAANHWIKVNEAEIAKLKDNISSIQDKINNLEALDKQFKAMAARMPV